MKIWECEKVGVDMSNEKEELIKRILKRWNEIEPYADSILDHFERLCALNHREALKTPSIFSDPFMEGLTLNEFTRNFYDVLKTMDRFKEYAKEVLQDE